MELLSTKTIPTVIGRMLHLGCATLPSVDKTGTTSSMDVLPTSGEQPTRRENARK